MKHSWVRGNNAKELIEDQSWMLRAIRVAARCGCCMDVETLALLLSSLQGLGNPPPEPVALKLEKAYAQLRKPSDYFRILAELGVLETLYAPLTALRKVPAGPENTRHGMSSAFEHTLKAVDRAKANDYSFGVFLAVLCHDFGKAATPADLLPHHYGHEERSAALAHEWLEQNHFRKQDAELTVVFARQHMKLHVLEEMRPAKLMRFFRELPRNYRDDIFKAGNCDSPLTERQWQIVRTLEKTQAEAAESRVKSDEVNI